MGVAKRTSKGCVVCCLLGASADGTYQRIPAAEVEKIFLDVQHSTSMGTVDTKNPA